MAAPAMHVPDIHHHVPIGHDAATGQPVSYIAADGLRVCNGLITGQDTTETSALARRIAEHLRGPWDVRIVTADDSTAGQTLDALWAAERAQGRRERHDPLHLLVWDGLHHFLRDPVLDAAKFSDRVAALAANGPYCGVAQLATTYALLPIAYGDHRLRDLLADNVIALHGRRDTGALLGGTPINPGYLLGRHGHGLVLTGGWRAEVVHAHLDGCRPVEGCDACWRAEHDRLGQLGLVSADGVLRGTFS